MLTHFSGLLLAGAVLLATRVVFAATPEPHDRPYPGTPTEFLTGRHVSARGNEIEWLRDPLDVDPFHLKVPTGVEHLEARFIFAVPFWSGEPIIRPQMFELYWNKFVLYSAGYYDRGIQVTADLSLPGGSDCATALEGSYCGLGMGPACLRGISYAGT